MLSQPVVRTAVLTCTTVLVNAVAVASVSPNGKGDDHRNAFFYAAVDDRGRWSVRPADDGTFVAKVAYARGVNDTG